MATGVRTSGAKGQGLEKVETSSDDYKALVTAHADGTFTGWTPKSFHDSHEDWQEKYVFKALQTAWNNAKRHSGGKAAQQKACTFFQPMTTRQ